MTHAAVAGKPHDSFPWWDAERQCDRTDIQIAVEGTEAVSTRVKSSSSISTLVEEPRCRGCSEATNHDARRGMLAQVPARVALSARVGKVWVELGEYEGPKTCHEEVAHPLASCAGAALADRWLGFKCRALRFRPVGGKKGLKVGVAFGV